MFFFSFFSWFSSTYWWQLPQLFTVFISLKSLTRFVNQRQGYYSLYFTLRKDGSSWKNQWFAQTTQSMSETTGLPLYQTPESSAFRCVTSFHKYVSVEEKVCTYVTSSPQTHLKVLQIQQGKHEYTYFREKETEVLQVYRIIDTHTV